jgi:hypothetical protein
MKVEIGNRGTAVIAVLWILSLILCGIAVDPSAKDTTGRMSVYTSGGPTRMFISPDRRYVHTQGVWVVGGDDPIASPINLSDIICDRDGEGGGTCTEHRAFVHTMNPRPTLMMVDDAYTVTKWTNNEIVAKSNAGLGCRDISLKLDLKRGHVGTVTTSPTGCVDDGAHNTRLNSPRRGRLISGDELDRVLGHR